MAIVKREIIIFCANPACGQPFEEKRGSRKTLCPSCFMRKSYEMGKTYGPLGPHARAEKSKTPA